MGSRDVTQQVNVRYSGILALPPQKNYKKSWINLSNNKHIFAYQRRKNNKMYRLQKANTCSLLSMSAHQWCGCG